MLFVTHYSTLAGDRTKASAGELMSVFADRGAPPGQVAHDVYRDGGGGFLIADESLFERLDSDGLAYFPWLDLTTRPILSIDEAVPQIGEWLQT